MESSLDGVQVNWIADGLNALPETTGTLGATVSRRVRALRVALGGDGVPAALNARTVNEVAVSGNSQWTVTLVPVDEYVPATFECSS